MTALSADRRSSNPQDDLFGHTPFAESLANSICRYPGNDGLVLALYGPWGSGKSTVLSYVRHFLEQRPEAEQPVMVTFNPWLVLRPGKPRPRLSWSVAGHAAHQEREVQEVGRSAGRFCRRRERADRPEWHDRRCGQQDRQADWNGDQTQAQRRSRAQV
jgi:hypothetical protein